MNHLHFRFSLTNRHVGFCLGLVYLLQVTILPIVHYRVHVEEHSEHSVQKMQYGSDDHQADCEHQDVAASAIIHVAKACHDTSHDSSTCSVCSSIFKSTTSSYDILSLTNLFSEELVSPAPHKPCLSPQFSPKSPRAPPSKLTFS